MRWAQLTIGQIVPPLLAQTSSAGTPQVNPWAQLGVASIVCALLFAIVLTLWRDNQKLRSTCDSLRDAQVSRERELSTGVLPLLQQAASLLAVTPERFDRALGEAREGARASEIDTLVRRMETVLQERRPGG